MGYFGNKKAVDKTEKQQRIRSVVEWIIQGYSTADIIRQCVSLWNISRRQAYNYNKWAVEELKENNQKSLEEKKSIHIEMRLKLYRDLKRKDTTSGARAAVRIADSLARIEGLLDTRDNRVYGDAATPDVEDKLPVMILPNGKEIEV